MIKIKIEQTNKGITTRNQKGNFNLKFPKNFGMARRQMRRDLKFVDNIFHETLNEIADLVLDDTLNETREGRSGLRHFVTGDLFNSIGLRVSGTTKDEVEITFGYFIQYGLNLEQGGPRSRNLRKNQQLNNGASKEDVEQMTRAYPIIVPTWEKHKNQVSEDIRKQVFESFKKRV